jgi:hypothetical protein
MRYQTAPRPEVGRDCTPGAFSKRATGIEPVLRAWKALVQPLHHARGRTDDRRTGHRRPRHGGTETPEAGTNRSCRSPAFTSRRCTTRSGTRTRRSRRPARSLRCWIGASWCLSSRPGGDAVTQRPRPARCAGRGCERERQAGLPARCKPGAVVVADRRGVDPLEARAVLGDETGDDLTDAAEAAVHAIQVRIRRRSVTAGHPVSGGGRTTTTVVRLPRVDMASRLGSRASSRSR